MTKRFALDVGANFLGGDEVQFRVWAPYVKKMELDLLSETEGWLRVPMQREDALGNQKPGERGEEGHAPGLERGFHVVDARASQGTRYRYILDGSNRRPDPVSRFQPEGVHSASAVVDPESFEWTDRQWKGISQEDLAIYELHTGAYTPEGTFSSLVPYIGYLKNELGVTAIEVMPVAQFPGNRNWGYDGVGLFAPQNSYGGPGALKMLVDSCHAGGLAVILDVVYNHLGPEGNYLHEFGPYFSDKYRTPWGPAMNYDDRGCDEVRHFVVSNALYWISEYHMDGLRLDAIHGIFDFSPKNILAEIGEQVHSLGRDLGRDVHVIPESDLNDPKVVMPERVGGYGLDAQMSDDFHHSVHAFLTGEISGYYQDFGSLWDIMKSLRDGFVYDGKYSRFRWRRHGSSLSGLPGKRFVIFLQNHDQVGNRPDGARLGTLIDRPALKAAVALLLLSPYLPLLFMGEEYGETAPFYYFVSHSDRQLVDAVREGRQKEFASGGLERLYRDPQDESTFLASKLNHGLLNETSSAELFQYYRALLTMRKAHPALRHLDRGRMDIRMIESEKTLTVRRWAPDIEDLFIVYMMSETAASLEKILPEGQWMKVFDSTAPNTGQNLEGSIETPWDGVIELAPYSVTIYSNRSIEMIPPL